MPPRTRQPGRTGSCPAGRPIDKRAEGRVELGATVLPPRHSSCTQFSMPSRAECRQVTPCRVSSASETRAGTTSKTHFKLRALSFCFVSKGAAGRLWRLDSTENTRFETQPPFSTQAACCNRKRINAGGLHFVRKTAGRRASQSAGRVSSLGWLAHELNRIRDLGHRCD